MKNYVIKGNICYSKTSREISIVENGYVVCEDGRCAGVYEVLPEIYQALPCFDYENKIVIPGLVDLHSRSNSSSVRCSHICRRTLERSSGCRSSVRRRGSMGNPMTGMICLGEPALRSWHIVFTAGKPRWN